MPLMLKLQGAIASKNKGLKNQVEHEVRDILANLDTSAELNFQRYFGISIGDLQAKIDVAKNMSDLVVSSNVIPEQISTSGTWVGIQDKFVKLQTNAVSARGNFSESFSTQVDGTYAVPKGLTTVTKYMWAGEQININVLTNKTSLDLNHVLNALVMAGALSGVALLGEKVLLPASNAVLDRIASEV